MATDCEISINVDPESVTRDKAYRFVEALAQDGFLTLRGDLEIAVDPNQTPTAVTSLEEVESLLNDASDDFLYFRMKFHDDFDADVPDSKLSALVNEIVAASVNASNEEPEFSAASIYTASFRKMHYDYEGIPLTDCGLYFGGDGWLSGELIAHHLAGMPVYERLTSRIEGIFGSKVAFDSQPVG